MTIAAIVRNKSGAIISVGEDTPVADVVKLLADARIGAVPVLRGDAVVGVLSERDVVHELASQGSAIMERTAAAAMTSPAITVDPGMPVLAALSLMTQRRIRHLPVIDGGAMIGFVSIGDLVKFRIDGIEAEAEALRSYISSV